MTLYYFVLLSTYNNISARYLSTMTIHTRHAKQLMGWQHWLIIGLVACILLLLAYIGTIHVKKHTIHKDKQNHFFSSGLSDPYASKAVYPNQQDRDEQVTIQQKQVAEPNDSPTVMPTMKQEEKEYDSNELTQEQIIEARQQLILSQEEKDAKIFKMLQELIEGEKLYLNPSLSRAMLLNKTHIQKAQFSPIIRKFTNKSFPQYVNDLRLKHAIEMMREHEDYTIDAIAMESGMGSIQTFYRIFTERYGIAPNEYRKILNAKKEQN